eukprot:GDKI01039662.1.p1 GENE.GDKI01039662.1~~GDKI01039662.1.p1  ORF type:complete len:114 (-),score=19.24 GDKI01039662.1:166-507(-)
MFALNYSLGVGGCVWGGSGVCRRGSETFIARQKIQTQMRRLEGELGMLQRLRSVCDMHIHTQKATDTTINPLNQTYPLRRKPNALGSTCSARIAELSLRMDALKSELDALPPS